MPHVVMFHERDPREVLLEKIGDISKEEIAPTQLLVAIYEPPKKTASGIHITDPTASQYQYQGKVALVLKMGSNVFVDDHIVQFHGFSCEVGDWIVFRPADGWPVSINKCPCRMIDDHLVKLKVSHPDVAY